MAFTRVQGTGIKYQETSTTVGPHTLDTSSLSNFTADNWIAIQVVHYGDPAADIISTFTVNGVTLTAGTHRIVQRIQSPNIVGQAEIWWYKVPAGTPDKTVSVTYAGPANTGGVGHYTTYSIVEWSAPGVTLVGTGTGNGSNNQPSVSNSSGSPAIGDLVLSVFVISDSTTTSITQPSASPPWTVEFSEPDPNAHEAGSGISRIVTSAGTQTATWTMGNAQNWAAVMAVFTSVETPPIRATQRYAESAIHAGSGIVNISLSTIEQTSIVAGRCAIMFVWAFSTNSVSLSNAATGMTLLGSVSGSGLATHVYIKELTGSEGSTWTATLSGGDYCDAGIVFLCGVDVQATIDAGSLAINGSTGTSNTASAAAVTAPTDDTLILFSSHANNGWGTPTSPSGMVALTSTSADNACHVSIQRVNAGSTGTKTAGPGSASRDWVGIQVALHTSNRFAAEYRYFRLTSRAAFSNNINAAAAEFNLLDGSGSVINRSGWTVSASSAQDSDGFEATKAIDGNLSTFWHTRYSQPNPGPPSPAEPDHPHTFTIDLGSAQEVSALRYTPRDSSPTSNGTITYYDLDGSDDNSTWTSVGGGQFNDNVDAAGANSTWEVPIGIMNSAIEGISFPTYSSYVTA